MIHRARGSTRPVTFTILIGDTAQDLTGCTVTVDGGNPSASPR